MKKTLFETSAESIHTLIRDFVVASPENDLGLPDREPAFGVPWVGFSSGADPLYDEYVAHIGDFYLTPLRAFETAFPEGSGIPSGDLTVISWILPSTAATRREQATRVRRPGERWARTRLLGEKFNDALRRHVVDRLAAAGIPAVAPMLAPFWRRVEEGPYAPCSNWSERHAAYAAGLGTFGLCDGLITPVGKAMRTGSVVAGIKIPASPRPYTDRHAYCLHYSHGTCGKCIDRCPVRAISRTGHDKQICGKYTGIDMRAYMTREYGVDISGCGLCQVDIPCMDHIPSPDEG